jgi:DNA ligase (NAD+)
MMQENQIKELEKQIRFYSDIYYNGSAEQQESEGISDEEFDSLVAELKKLNPDSEVLQEVGAPVTDERRERLVTPMLSQEKALTRQESLKCLKRFRDFEPIVLEEKLDGCGLDLTYVKGSLASAVTRGTWIEGTQVVDAARCINNLPKTLNVAGFADIIHVRGEVVIRDKDFEQINDRLVNEGKQPFSNTRNLASGTIKLEDLEEVRKRCLFFVAYEIFRDADLFASPKEGEAETTHSAKLQYLKDFGFTTPAISIHTTCTDKNAVLDKAYSILETLKDEEGNVLPYAIDGVVIKIDNQQTAKLLGATQHHPRCSFAVKPEAESTWVTVDHIDWTMSRLGTVTPTAVFKGVELSGATISRANVHNLNNMERFNVCPGTRLKIVRSGLVIPKIVGSDMHSEKVAISGGKVSIFGSELTLEDAKKQLSAKGFKFIEQPGALLYYNPELYRDFIPSTDPSTGSPLVETLLSENGARVMRVSDVGANYFAIAKKIEHFLKSIRCLGWGEQLLTNYCFNSKVKSLQEFLETMSADSVKKNITLSDVSDEYAKKLSTAVKESIQNPDLVAVIKGLGIARAQASVEQVVYDLKSVDDLLNPAVWSKYVTDGVLSYIRKDLSEREQEIRDICAFLKLQFNAVKKEIGQKLVNKTFVITGTLSAPREVFEDLIKYNGGKFATSISRNTTYLLKGKGGGSKAEKAAKFGVKIITEEDFNKMLE